MTIRDAAYGKLPKNFPTTSYNVGFNDGDETQFDINSLSELEECWLMFCREEGCSPDSVDYVEKD